VYRIHEPPEVKKVAEFEEVAAGFGYSLGTGPLPIERRRVRGRVVEVARAEKFTISPRHYQQLAERLAGKPEERMLSFLMLRSLKQARYSAHNAGHFALATDCYTHFTSPIRRYPDLLVHRILKALLGGEEAPAGLGKEESLEPLTRRASEQERAADEAERELMDWKKVRFMEPRVGEEFPAMILHVHRDGFFVELEDLFIEGLVPADALDDDAYFFRSTTREWVGERTRKRYRLGQKLKVRVERIDPVRMQILFAPAGVSHPKKTRRR
jgi:ribonuclease R